MNNKLQSWIIEREGVAIIAFAVAGESAPSFGQDAVVAGPFDGYDLSEAEKVVSQYNSECTCKDGSDILCPACKILVGKGE